MSNMIAYTKQASGTWRNYQHDIAQLRKLVLKYDLSGWSLWKAATQQRRHLRRYLRARFKYDTLRCRFLKSACVLNTPYEIGVLTGMLGMAAFWDVAFAAGLHGADVAKQNGTDIDTEMTEAILRVFDAFPIMAGVGMTGLPYASQREAAVFSLAGYMAANISLSKNKRLADALSAEGGNPTDTLHQTLPGAVCVAWEDRLEGEPLIGAASLRSRVTKYLEVERSRDSDYGTDLVPEPIQEFAAAESARAELAALKDEAGLSRREREVLDFRLQGYKEDEIAVRLGIAKGTVKALAFRARGKLLRLAS